MDAIVHDCKCGKKLNKIAKNDLPFQQSLNSFGFNQNAVVTTKINLNSNFFSSKVFKQEKALTGAINNTTLKNELNILMNHIDEGSADKRTVTKQDLSAMRSPRNAAGNFKSPKNTTPKYSS